jgi:hypothetical protein
MALDTVPTSSQSDGRWKIAFVAIGDDPLSAADVIAADDVTYSFTADGFDWQITETLTEDKRLTLDQNLSAPGRSTETLNLRYVDSTTAGSPAVEFTNGLEGYFVVRRGIANATEWAASQIVDVITVRLGKQRPDAPVENGVDTISQQAAVTDVTQQKVTLAA